MIASSKVTIEGDHPASAARQRPCHHLRHQGRVSEGSRGRRAVTVAFEKSPLTGDAELEDTLPHAVEFPVLFVTRKIPSDGRNQARSAARPVSGKSQLRAWRTNQAPWRRGHGLPRLGAPCQSSPFSLASSCACGMTIIRRRTSMSSTRVSKPSSKFGPARCGSELARESEAGTRGRWYGRSLFILAVNTAARFWSPHAWQGRGLRVAA